MPEKVRLSGDNTTGVGAMKHDEEGSKVPTIELPFKDALVRAASQNFDRDVRKGVVEESEWNQPLVQKEYLSEARGILLRDGENSKPEFPDHEQIVLAKKTK